MNMVVGYCQFGNFKTVGNDQWRPAELLMEKQEIASTDNTSSNHTEVLLKQSFRMLNAGESSLQQWDYR